MSIIIPIILFALISVSTIYSASSLLPSYMHNLYLKQFVWYVLGFGVAYAIMSIGNKILHNSAYVLYVINVIYIGMASAPYLPSIIPVFYFVIFQLLHP